jgi:hypothetical protein
VSPVVGIGQEAHECPITFVVDSVDRSNTVGSPPMRANGEYEIVHLKVGSIGALTPIG